MSDIFKELEIKASGKTQFMLQVPGSGLEIPSTVIRGAQEGPLLLITSGVHGSEYPGIMASLELARELDPAALRGKLALLHPVNTGAFRERVAFNMPTDGHNLNRMFPGDPDGSDSEKTAWLLTRLQDLADFYLDLHSGDLFEWLAPFAYFPGNAGEKVLNASLGMARCLDVPYLVRSTARTGAYNSAALRGTPALLLERGGAGFCFRDEVELYKRDVLNVMTHLGMLDAATFPIRRDGPEARELGRVVYLMSGAETGWEAFVKPGERVSAGQRLGVTLDAFGNVIEEHFAECNGVVLYMLYAMSARTGDVLAAYGD